MEPGGVREIQLSKGLIALVDASDFESFGRLKWYANGVKFPYASRQEGRKTYLLHREIMAPADGLCVDHINGDTLDNRRSNLRICTRVENARNRRVDKSTASGFKGVRPSNSRWRAKIRHDGAWVCIGSFDTPEEAARAYDREAITRFGEFARLNFPEAQHGL